MRSPALSTYLALSRAADPAARLALKRRAARGKEDPERLAERLGVPSRARPSGRLIWMHGASVGESLSMLPLIAALREAEPEIGLLVTTGTVTSARRMAALLPEGVIHQFVPVDTAAAVARFLDHWKPDVAIWVESEFWPRLMIETHRRGTPMMLVNARLSARSARGWARAPGMARELVRLYSLALTQDAATRTRLIDLGAEPSRVEEGGNLKVAIPPPSADGAELERLRQSIGTRPVWLAASTHAPEEEVVAEAHALAAPGLNGLLTLLAPRHPERADEIAAMLADRGLTVARRSTDDAPDDCEVFLADTLGEMGLWLRLAPVTFVGGSIAPMGGHNPFEPAALGSAILHGPQTQNFAPAYAALGQAGAARETGDAEAIADSLTQLLAPDGREARARMTEAASAVRSAQMPDTKEIAARALALLKAGRK